MVGFLLCLRASWLFTAMKKSVSYWKISIYYICTVKTPTGVALSVLLPIIRTKPYIFYCLLLHLNKFAFKDIKDPFSCKHKIKWIRHCFKRKNFVIVIEQYFFTYRRMQKYILEKYVQYFQIHIIEECRINGSILASVVIVTIALEVTVMNFSCQ